MRTCPTADEKNPGLIKIARGVVNVAVAVAESMHPTRFCCCEFVRPLPDDLGKTCRGRKITDLRRVAAAKGHGETENPTIGFVVPKEKVESHASSILHFGHLPLLERMAV